MLLLSLATQTSASILVSFEFALRTLATAVFEYGTKGLRFLGELICFTNFKKDSLFTMDDNC